MLSRADIEMELARLVLMQRSKDRHAVEDADRVAWFEDQCAGLLARTAPEHRAFVLARCRQLVEGAADPAAIQSIPPEAGPAPGSDHSSPQR